MSPDNPARYDPITSPVRALGALLAAVLFAAPLPAQPSNPPITIRQDKARGDSADTVVILTRAPGFVVLIDYLPGWGFARRTGVLGPFEPGEHEVAAPPRRWVRRAVLQPINGWPAAQADFQHRFPPTTLLTDAMASKLTTRGVETPEIAGLPPGPAFGPEFKKIHATPFALLYQAAPDLARLDRALAAVHGSGARALRELTAGERRALGGLRVDWGELDTTRQPG